MRESQKQRGREQERVRPTGLHVQRETEEQRHSLTRVRNGERGGRCLKHGDTDLFLSSRTWDSRSPPLAPGTLRDTAGISQTRHQRWGGWIASGEGWSMENIKGNQGPGFIGRTPGRAHRPEFLAKPPGNILMGR